MESCLICCRYECKEAADWEEQGALAPEHDVDDLIFADEEWYSSER